MANNYEHARAFSLFWENSKLNKTRMFPFGELVDLDARTPGVTPQLYYSSVGEKLGMPDDALMQTMLRRKSEREFGNGEISRKEFGSLLSGFASREDGRMLASGGGKYPIEIFAFCYGVENFSGSLVYYNADDHSVSRVINAPAWTELAEILNIEFGSPPAIVVVFVAFPERTVGKYGERGGRFALIEAGMYAQQLSLRATYEKIPMVLIGGIHDDAMLRLLGLEDTGAIVALGVAVGAPTKRVKKFFWK